MIIYTLDIWARWWGHTLINACGVLLLYQSLGRSLSLSRYVCMWLLVKFSMKSKHYIIFSLNSNRFCAFYPINWNIACGNRIHITEYTLYIIHHAVYCIEWIHIDCPLPFEIQWKDRSISIEWAIKERMSNFLSATHTHSLDWVFFWCGFLISHHRW